MPGNHSGWKRKTLGPSFLGLELAMGSFKLERLF